MSEARARIAPRGDGARNPFEEAVTAASKGAIRWIMEMRSGFAKKIKKIQAYIATPGNRDRLIKSLRRRANEMTKDDPARKRILSQINDRYTTQKIDEHLNYLLDDFENPSEFEKRIIMDLVEIE